jgi:hypothetical protein
LNFSGEISFSPPNAIALSGKSMDRQRAAILTFMSSLLLPTISSMSTPAGKATFQMCGIFSEFEKIVIRE